MVVPPAVSKVKKGTAVLTNDFYNHPKTNLLTFFFEPHLFESSSARMEKCSVSHTEIEGKDIYLIDGFFPESEASELRTFSSKATFSNPVYGNRQSQESGQKPMRAMNNKERWMFFSDPPKAIQEMYQLLSYLSLHLDAEISTVPWDLCHQTTSTTAVSTNHVSGVSSEDMRLGAHEDYDPEEGVLFGIPVLYAQEKTYHVSNFINGDVGKPLLVSAMLYSTAENFLPEYGMGTVFYQKNGHLAFRADCLHMRLVLFEGNITHSIEKSSFPQNIASERVSYVFKIVINPRQANQSMKKQLFNLMQGSS